MRDIYSVEQMTESERDCIRRYGVGFASPAQCAEYERQEREQAARLAEVRAERAAKAAEDAAARHAAAVARANKARSNPQTRVITGVCKYLGGGSVGLREGRKEFVLIGARKGATVSVTLINGFVSSFVEIT